MADTEDLDAIERRIEALRIAVASGGRDTTERLDKLQRLYVERERAQERQFKKSIARRAKRSAK